MRNRVVFAVQTSVASALVLAAASQAEASRRFSLAGNRLIPDRDDVFVYPQLATDHTRLVAFDYGAASNSGDALLLLGDKYQAWGLALHRGDAMTHWKISPDGDLPYLGDYGSGLGLAVQDPQIALPDASGGGPGAAGLGVTPKTIVDAIYASGDPATGGWGLRLSLGSDKTFEDSKASGVKENSTSEHFLAGTFGYTDRTGNLAYDLGVGALIDMGTQVANGKDALKGSRYDLSANFRGTMPLEGEKDTRLGILGQFHYGLSTIETTADKAAGDASADDLRLVGGVGPVISVTERILVSAYGTLGLARQTHDPNSKDKGDLDGRLAILFPGVNLATEIRLKDWMFFRTGTEYTYHFNIQDFGKSPGGFEKSNRSASFLWNAGLGFQFADLTLDGALSHQFLTSGPDFIGGDPSALFAMVSASAKF